MSKEEAERIVNEVDVNNNGLIDYIEWTQATTDNKILVTEDNLRDAFNAFDEDHDGNISLDEIKNFLSWGRKIKENAWRKILDEVDINKDGHLDYQEFREMMKSFIS